MTTVILDVILLTFLIVIGVPIPFCFAAAALFMVWMGDYNNTGFLISAGFTKVTSIILIAIPLYILAGAIMSEGGLARRLVLLAESVFGRFRGGLGLVVVVTTAVFGAISGAAASAVAAIGSIMIPLMEERGYDRGYATGLIACASVLALLIPPSGAQILYGWVTGTPITACFLATVIPGLLLMAFFGFWNFVLTRSMPVHREEPLPWRDDLARAGKHMKRSVLALFLPIIILGTIYGGIATPTEAAVIAVFYALPVSVLIHRELPLRAVGPLIWNAAVTTGVIIALAFTAVMLSRMFVMENVPQVIAEAMFSITTDPIMILLMVNVFLVLVGMLMEDVSGILLTAPMLLPVVREVGVDPVHFAAILGVNLGMGLITPPTAPILYFAGRIGSVGIERTIKPTLVFVFFAYLPVLLLTTYIPWLSLMLPRVVLGY